MQPGSLYKFLGRVYCRELSSGCWVLLEPNTFVLILSFESKIGRYHKEYDTTVFLVNGVLHILERKNSVVKFTEL